MDKYLIINADDFGVSHGTNEAILNLYLNKRITSTTIIDIAPWANEAIKLARNFKNISIGLHLTHTCEWDNLSWKSLSGIDLYKTKEEALKIPFSQRLYESKLQIKELLKENVRIDHLDNHMCTLDDNLIEYLKLAKEYDLAIRCPIKDIKDKKISDYIKYNQIDTIDYLNKYGDIYKSDREHYESHKEAYINMLDHLEEGINEFFMHPSLDTEELRAFADDYKVRIFDYEFLMSDDFIDAIKKNNIKLINYSDIKRIRRSYEN